MPFLKPSLSFPSGGCESLGPARLALWGSSMPDGIVLGVLECLTLTSVNPRTPAKLLPFLLLFSLLRSSAPNS